MAIEEKIYWIFYGCFAAVIPIVWILNILPVWRAKVTQIEDFTGVEMQSARGLWYWPKFYHSYVIHYVLDNGKKGKISGSYAWYQRRFNDLKVGDYLIKPRWRLVPIAEKRK